MINLPCILGSNTPQAIIAVVTKVHYVQKYTPLVHYVQNPSNTSGKACAFFSVLSQYTVIIGARKNVGDRKGTKKRQGESGLGESEIRVGAVHILTSNTPVYLFVSKMSTKKTIKFHGLIH